MAQAISDVDLNPNNTPNQGPGSNPNQKAASAKAGNAPNQSAISKAATSIKESSLSASKYASEKSKQRLSMEGQLKQARISLERYVNPKILKKQINEDTRIPKWVLKRAKGLVFLSVIKAGFLFAGNVGTGCVIVRQPNGGWTGPSSLGVAGVSFGFLAGASKVDYMMILPDDKAVKQFTGKGQLRLGGEIQLAVGPIGREGSGSVGAGDKGASIVYSYSHCQGLYGGLALDGKVIAVRPECNKAFYKRTVQCDEILNGNVEDVPSNEDYDMIIHLLDSYCLDEDMTPIKGEKLSIDDLNRNDNSTYDGDDEKKANASNEPTVMDKVSSSFNKLSSSVSQKWLSLTASDGKNKNKEQVALQQGDKDQKKKAQYKIGGDDQ
eukprot:437543_1